MNFMVYTKERSKQSEFMDDLEMSSPLLIKALDDISAINKWLGGNRVTLNALKILIKNTPKDKVMSIVDIGCGRGDILREIAKYGRENGYQFKLLGIDANQTTIDYATSLSNRFEEIEYIKLDVLSKEFVIKKFDIALCTLFLHHFNNTTALNIIQSLMNNIERGMIINDLHRCRLAYFLFKILSLFIQNKMTRADGATSILRGFKKTDLVSFSKQIKHESVIRWKWAFRYQWIIIKNDCKNN